MAGGIFISYRRDDTRHVAGRLAGDLMDRFGAESIFRDIDSIDAGDEFPRRLDKALNHASGSAPPTASSGGAWTIRTTGCAWRFPPRCGAASGWCR